MTLQDNWLDGLKRNVDNPYSKSVGVTPEIVERFYALCCKFHVAYWYIISFHETGSYTPYQYSWDGGADKYSLLGLMYGDIVVEDPKAMLDLAENVPTLFYNSFVLKPEHAGYQKYLVSWTTGVVQSKTYEEYLTKLSKSNRYATRKAKELYDTATFQESTAVYDIESGVDFANDNPDLMERILQATTCKYFNEDPYHAQALLCWSLAVGGKLVVHESEYGIGYSVLTNKKLGYWNLGFFYCDSKNPLFLKAFTLTLLMNTCFVTPDIFITGSNGTSKEYFADQGTIFSHYKRSMADSTYFCGLLASSDDPEVLDTLQPPYYSHLTKQWVLRDESK